MVTMPSIVSRVRGSLTLENRAGRTAAANSCYPALDLNRAEAHVTPLLLTSCRRVDHECRLRAQEWWHCPWKDIADLWAARCPRASEVIYGSWYAGVSDPVPGRNDVLWPVLEGLAR
jgi:hypothetical protein